MAAPLRTFIHYVGLRGQSDTQLEHRKIALCIGRQIKLQVPTVVEAILDLLITSDESPLEGWRFLR